MRRQRVPTDFELSRPDPPEVRPVGSPDDAVVLTYKVPGELGGLRLDRFIQHRIPRLSRTRAQAIIRTCAMHPDGRRRRSSDIVHAGETVYLVRERFVEPVTPLHFGVVYEDEYVLVVDKPAGLPMHPSATYHKHTLSYLLRERYVGQFTPRLAHRLDRETSGLVVCARTLESERKLKRAFALHGVQKTYLAIVRGEIAVDTGEMTQPMAPVREGLHVLMEIRDDGLPSHTDFRVIERRAGHSLVELFPRTGRQHQLRVHLSALGHPIVGDKLYGPEREQPFLEHIETGMTDDLLQRLGLPRQALHAHRLQLKHPDSGEAFEAVSPLAEDLQCYWDALASA